MGQAAKELGVHRTTVLRMVRRGELAAEWEVLPSGTRARTISVEDVEAVRPQRSLKASNNAGRNSELWQVRAESAEAELQRVAQAGHSIRKLVQAPLVLRELSARADAVLATNRRLRPRELR